MTTNAGATLTSSQAGFGSTSHEVAKDKTEKALSSFLRPEFINRIDEIITFRSLEEEDFVEIAKIMLNDMKVALGERSIRFTFTDEACKLIAKESYSKKFGARNMRRYIRSHVEDALAEKIISDYKSEISIASLSVNDENKLFVECI